MPPRRVTSRKRSRQYEKVLKSITPRGKGEAEPRGRRRAGPRKAA